MQSMPELKTANKQGGSLRKSSHSAEVFKRLIHHRSAIIGMIILAFYVLVAIFADLIAPYAYDLVAGSPLQKPCAEYLFGTDNMGRDLFSRVVYGTRYSITLGIGSTLIGVIAGMILGCIAGFYGGIIDELLMRFSDVIQSIPGVLLNMALSVAFGSGFFNTMLALGFSIVASVARLQRSAILNVRRMEYIDAASSTNCSDGRIVLKHIIPNSLSPILVYASMEIGHVIMSASGLSFLGLGIQPPTPEWGALLAAGRDYLKRSSYLCVCPGVVLVVFVLAINLFGDGLRDAMDPKLKK